MTENEKQDLYMALYNNKVTRQSDQRVVGPYIYTNNNYSFGPYRILFRMRAPAFPEIKHGEVFIFKYLIEKSEPLFMGHWDGTVSEWDYLFDMYMAAKDKSNGFRYKDPYSFAGMLISEQNIKNNVRVK